MLMSVEFWFLFILFVGGEGLILGMEGVGVLVVLVFVDEKFLFCIGGFVVGVFFVL